MLTGSENSAVLLALHWYMVFQIIQYLISCDNYIRCHMTLLAKKPKKMLKVYQTLLPTRGWGLGMRLDFQRILWICKLYSSVNDDASARSLVYSTHYRHNIEETMPALRTLPTVYDTIIFTPYSAGGKKITSWRQSRSFVANSAR